MEENDQGTSICKQRTDTSGGRSRSLAAGGDDAVVKKKYY